MHQILPQGRVSSEISHVFVTSTFAKLSREEYKQMSGLGGLVNPALPS